MSLDVLHYLYVIENLITNQVYVGQTINPTRRWAKHKYEETNRYLKNSMRKYGLKAFNFTVVSIAGSFDEINQLEIYWIDRLRNFLGHDQVFNVENGGKTYTEEDAIRRRRYFADRVIDYDNQPPFELDDEDEDEIFDEDEDEELELD